MNFTTLISDAIVRAGKQETLAIELDLSPSALSKRLSGETGWSEREINKLLEITKYEICSIEAHSQKIETLKNAMKILLNGDSK